MWAHLLGKLLKDLIVESARNKGFDNIYSLYKIKKTKIMKNVNESYVAYGVIVLLVLFAALTSCAGSKTAYHSRPAKTGNYVCFGGVCVKK